MTQGAFEGMFEREQAHLRFEQQYGFWLAVARRIAMRICLEQGFVTSDDVLETLHLPPGASHNLIGCIFSKGGAGRFRAGGYTPTRRPQGHGRRIVRWVKA